MKRSAKGKARREGRVVPTAGLAVKALKEFLTKRAVFVMYTGGAVRFAKKATSNMLCIETTMRISMQCHVTCIKTFSYEKDVTERNCFFRRNLR